MNTNNNTNSNTHKTKYKTTTGTNDKHNTKQIQKTAVTHSNYDNKQLTIRGCA